MKKPKYKENEIMKRSFFIMSLIMLMIAGHSMPCFAGWIIFHKPPYKGKLIDAETKEPIEGAVVVAIYQKYPFISGPGGGSTSIVGVKEAVTDKNGEFSIPSYSTIMGPNSYEEATGFLFYKSGYYYWTGISLLMSEDGMEYYLLEKNYGKIGDIYSYCDEKVGHGPYGVIELKPAKTWEERRKIAWDTGPLYKISEKKWPLLYEMFEQERQWLKQNKGWRR